MTGRVCICAAMLLAAGASQALDAPDLHLRLRAGAWSGDRQLDDRRGASAGNLWLDAYQPLGPQAALKFEGWAYRESTGNPSFQPWRAREGYLRLDHGDLQARLGWQTFAWGRADRINPTDNLSARDHRTLVGQDEEQRFGSPAAMLAWSLGPRWRLQALAKRFDASVLPSAGREEALPWARHPDGRPEWAVRLDRNGDDGVDGSVSWFRGYDKQRALELTPDGAGLQRRHAGLTALGGDLAVAEGAWTFRTEAAALRLDGSAPAARGGKQGSVQWVLGAERALPASASLNLQWFGRRLRQPLADPQGLMPLSAALLRLAAQANGQTARDSQGLSLRYAQRLLNDRLDYELVALVGWGDRGRAFRPRLNWQWTDATRFTFGADVFRGPPPATFGVLRPNSLVFVEASHAL